MRKELAKVYKDIVNLSKAISELLKGDEPNMQALWGMAQEKEAASELSLEDLGTLKMATEKIKTNICDYYADKYSNECNIQ